MAHIKQEERSWLTGALSIFINSSVMSLDWMNLSLLNVFDEFSFSVSIYHNHTTNFTKYYIILQAL